MALKYTASNFLNQVKKSNHFHFRFFAVVTLILILFSSCSKDNGPQENPANTLACKKRPGQIMYGRDTSEIKYDIQDKPVKITTTKYTPSAPSQPPVTTVYLLAYNVEGRVDKVSKSVNNQPELYYQMEYNSTGQLIKQSRFNPQGILITSTLAQYDNTGVLIKIITHNEGSSAEAITFYDYANGSLIKKTIQNLYDLDSQEFYSADYTYTYFTDKENKVTTLFEGPLGLLFISNLSSEQSLQFFPDRTRYQLLFAQETSAEKKMLKSIEIIAHRYNTNDTTNIDYSYEYDTDGFPTVQRGTYQNVTRRYVPDPFVGSVLVVTPHNNSFESTMNFSCD